MPLPDNARTAWPPAEHEQAAALYRTYAAWWSGDLGALARVYAGAIGYGDSAVDASTDRPALAGGRERFFHGQAISRGALRPAKMHIPLASDIATTSADLLFGEPPVLVDPDDDGPTTVAGKTADKAKPADKAGNVAEKKRGLTRFGRRRPTKAKATATQDRLDDYLTGGLQAVLIEAAEIAAAFGGVYLRVGWDKDVADRPLFDAIPPDAACPEFRSGALVAVTFHRELAPAADGGVWRHLERHEKGRIFHGLYRSGDSKTLGERRPLAAHPETEAFDAITDTADGGVETGAIGLAVEYVPNMRPHRRLRGSMLGRSDFDGIESQMDALDESWTSWMRDLRLGKGRLLVPEQYLDDTGRGEGAVFDLEQEVYQPLNALTGPTEGLAIEVVQFDIRVEQHERTCTSLIEQAVRGAGYSAQSFGMQGDGAMATATEVSARASRSMMTRGKKINYMRPCVARLIRTALEIDVKHFGPDGVRPVLPDVEWPDGVAVDPQTQAQTLAALKAADAASVRTRVEILHPDWDDTRVEEEAKAIREEGQPEPAEPPAWPGTAATDTGNAAGKPPAGAPAPASVGSAGKSSSPGETRPAPTSGGQTRPTPTSSNPGGAGTPRTAGGRRTPARR